MSRLSGLVRSCLVVSLVLGMGGCESSEAGNGPGPDAASWTYYGGTKAFTRYAPLDQITRDNVQNLRVAWTRPGVDQSFLNAFPDLAAGGRQQAYLKATPILVDSVLYAPNGTGMVEAFHPATGETIWVQQAFAETMEEVAGGGSRGIDYWTDGTDRRLVVVNKEYLLTLDPADGTPDPAFGDGGRVNLITENATRYNISAGPIVVGDVIVVAGLLDGARDSGNQWRGRPPQVVRGFDVRTGALLWTFNTIPQEGEFGVETWGNESWKESGDVGSWCCLSADEELGYVYVPLAAATAPFYGGHRPGDNLYSNSLVALDVATGERVWHFQMVHHDLWDYDNQGPPTLGEITVDGRRIKAVMQPSKTGWVYVFDRETGEPVWPIEERPVPQSTIPGEVTSPTQPFPTKPAPFARQGITADDLIDFTPELRERALAFADSFLLAPLFTPPILPDGPEGKRALLYFPGVWGSGNWNNGAFDPETGFYYAISHALPFVIRMLSDDPESEMDYWGDANFSRGAEEVTIEGIPIVKPPWGDITALDMNTGERVWQVANGDPLKDHPLLQGLDLPPLGVASRPAPLLTKTLLFIGEGSDVFGGIPSTMWGKTFRAYDKATGDVIWETELSAGTTGAPMTYMFEGKQYIVVPSGSTEYGAEWVALSLP